MRRRTFLGTVAAGAGVLAAPRLGGGAAASTLKFVPAQDLTLLDPIQSPSGSTIMHSCLVFDTLYGLDESYKAQPQMVEGHLIEDDGKIWKLTLRDGLKFHNGEPVRGRDVVASLQRWGKRDTFGQTLFSVTDELSAPSDKIIQFRLKKPFPMIPDALGKIGAFFAIIVPEHLAQTERMRNSPTTCRAAREHQASWPDRRSRTSIALNGTQFQTPRRQLRLCRRGRWTGGIRRLPTHCRCSARTPTSW
jgi:peptide/nickel transport system substrate-binding protein